MESITMLSRQEIASFVEKKKKRYVSGFPKKA